MRNRHRQPPPCGQSRRTPDAALVLPTATPRKDELLGAALDRMAVRIAAVYRGLRHRESAGLPAPLVEEPDLDAVAVELVELYRLRHGLRHREEVEARTEVSAA